MLFLCAYSPSPFTFPLYSVLSFSLHPTKHHHFHEINHYYCAQAHLLNRNVSPTPSAMSNARIARGPSWSMMFSSSEWVAYPSKPLQNRLDRPATDFPTHRPHIQHHPTPGNLNSQDQQSGSRVQSDKKLHIVKNFNWCSPTEIDRNVGQPQLHFVQQGIPYTSTRSECAGGPVSGIVIF